MKKLTINFHEWEYFVDFHESEGREKINKKYARKYLDNDTLFYNKVRIASTYKTLLRFW